MKIEEKPFCNFTIESSLFCSRCHDCSLCSMQPMPGELKVHNPYREATITEIDKDGKETIIEVGKMVTS